MRRSARVTHASTHAARRLRRSAARLIRDLGLQPNPLRRRSDRVQAHARLAALLVWVAAVPLATSIGSVVHDRLDAGVATRSSSPAVVLSDPADPSGKDGLLPRTATVTWTTATGVEHTSVAQIPWNARRGTRFTLWTDAAGRPTTPPSPSAVRWTDGLLAAAGVLVAAFVVLWLALLALRLLLDRQRYREWDLEWLQLGASRRRRGDGLR